MSVSKIQIAIGNVSFSGEGDEAWLTAQIDKILKLVPTVNPHPTNAAPPHDANAHKVSPPSKTEQKSDPGTTLSNFLKTHHGTEKQSRKFLATARWLQLSGNNHLQTGDVTKALKENHQKPLTNAAQCLVGAVTSGFCGRNGKEFFITPEGEAQLEKIPNTGA